MKIDVKKDQPGAVFNGQTGIDTRQVNTELLVESGTIVVIGGVIEEQVTESEDRTPYLNRIPLVGRLFKSKAKQFIRTELLVFISPKIIKGVGPKYTQRAAY
jgi:type IV pilus assembly protein PilQ